MSVDISPPYPNLHGHLWNDESDPELDDDGDWSSYAKCSRCGAVENTDEAVMDCKFSR